MFRVISQTFVIVNLFVLSTAQEDLAVLVKYADQIMEYAVDEYGARQTSMWASVVDARNSSIPSPGEIITPTDGTRNHDRAVWGSNLYHDLGNLRLFELLSVTTDDVQYTIAKEDYCEDFLRFSQNDSTGLLGWGEHIYYHFYADSLCVGEAGSDRTRYHEFLGATPPWEMLWSIDSTRVMKAIAALKYHFRGEITTSYLFNRHADWAVRHPEDDDWRSEQYQRDGQPWIKHSGLLAYSFAFLYTKTGDSDWLEWAQGVGSLYWNHRDTTTNLTVGCIDDQRPRTQWSSIHQLGYLSYWLLKTYELLPAQKQFLHMGMAYMEAIDTYHWNDEQRYYMESLYTDGRPVNGKAARTIVTGYGSSSMPVFGRIVAYFYEVTGDPLFEKMALRCVSQIRREKFPNDFVVNSLAEMLHYYLDMYDLTRDPSMLAEAQRLADLGLDKLEVNGWIVRQPDDHFYEAKVGCGDFAFGMMRLYVLNQNQHLYEDIDWSF